MENLLHDYIQYLQQYYNNAYERKRNSEFDKSVAYGYAKILHIMNRLLISNGLINNDHHIVTNDDKKIKQYFNGILKKNALDKESNNVLLVNIIKDFALEIQKLYNDTFDKKLNLSGENSAYFGALEWLDLQINLWGYRRFFRGVQILVNIGERVNLNEPR